MVITRSWAMPNKETFRIPPINALIRRYLNEIDGLWIDPFVRNSVFKDSCYLTNDLNPDFEADLHVEALEFLQSIEPDSISGVLFDPPYSLRQVKECYDNLGRNVQQWETQNGLYKTHRHEIARILQPNGVVICCGWNTNGMDRSKGFLCEEIMMVAHGGHITTHL